MEKKNKETQSNRMGLEAETRDLTNTFDKESQDNFSNTLYLNRRDATALLAKERFERDEKLLLKMLEEKNKEKQEIVDDRAKLESDFQAMKEVQDLITKENTFRVEIEEMHVKFQYLEVKFNMLDSAYKELMDKKQSLDNEKRLTAEKNEDLERQRKAKEEASIKKLQAKL